MPEQVTPPPFKTLTVALQASFLQEMLAVGCAVSDVGQFTFSPDGLRLTVIESAHVGGLLADLPRVAFLRFEEGKFDVEIIVLKEIIDRARPEDCITLKTIEEKSLDKILRIWLRDEQHDIPIRVSGLGLRLPEFKFDATVVMKTDNLRRVISAFENTSDSVAIFVNTKNRSVAFKSYNCQPKSCGCDPTDDGSWGLRSARIRIFEKDLVKFEGVDLFGIFSTTYLKLLGATRSELTALKLRSDYPLSAEGTFSNGMGTSAIFIAPRCDMGPLTDAEDE